MISWSSFRLPPINLFNFWQMNPYILRYEAYRLSEEMGDLFKPIQIDDNIRD
jgi:hypothetical protein